MEAVLVVRGFGSRAQIPGEPLQFLQRVFGAVRAERIMAGLDRNYGVLIGGVA
jgi:hypothetical protein